MKYDRNIQIRLENSDFSKLIELFEKRTNENFYRYRNLSEFIRGVLRGYIQLQESSLGRRTA